MQVPVNLKKKIDEELRAYYDASPSFDLSDIAVIREALHSAEMAGVKDNPKVHVYEKYIKGHPDNESIRTRIYEPADRTGMLPCLMFFHGGGFIFGGIERHETLLQRYAEEVPCICISVEYRLAPEYPAPAAAEDAYAALVWLSENGSEIGVDTGRIAIGGISAGGGIAVAAAMLARERKGPEIIFLMSIYAALDSRNITPSSQQITDPKVWSRGYNLTVWPQYVVDNKNPNVYGCPAVATDFSNLPPTYIYVGELDPLRDENIALASNLLEAGVTCELHLYPGAYHGFDLNVPNAAISRQATLTTINALKKALK